MNLCIFIGRLTRDPESRSTTTGKNVVSFAIAINEGKDKPATFVELEAWEGTGEFITKYFSKGDPISVQSQLKIDTWDDKTDGTKRSKAKFVVRQVSFVPGGKGNGGATEEETGPDPVKTDVSPKKPGRPKSPQKPPVEDDDEDIPF
jgi:single-strand DNA-binding protein